MDTVTITIDKPSMYENKYILTIQDGLYKIWMGSIHQFKRKKKFFFLIFSSNGTMKLKKKKKKRHF